MRLNCRVRPIHLGCSTLPIDQMAVAVVAAAIVGTAGPFLLHVWKRMNTRSAIARMVRSSGQSRPIPALRGRTVNLGRFAIPVWVIVAILLITAAVASVIVILSNTLTTTTRVGPASPPLLLSWNYQLPANMAPGTREVASLKLVNMQSTSYTATLAVNITASSFSIADPSIVSVDISATSDLWGSQTLILTSVNGHLQGQTGATTIGSDQVATVVLGVRFSTNVPADSYTLQFWVQQ